MSQELELIEARLTAYIDGQLPEKDRAEIEKYLAANPTHARLIAELQRQRAQLRTLPKEAAPVEIMDHLQAHLERNALLAEDQTESTMKINRWPQLGAVAAMLLLAAGLGALVYQVLPRGNQIVLAPPSVQQMPTVPSLVGDADKDAKELPAEKALERTEVAPEMKTMPGNEAATAERLKMPSAVGGEAAMNSAFDTNSASTTQPLPVAPVTHSSSIIVHTDDPAITRTLIATYLMENGLTFEVTKPASLPETSALKEPVGMNAASLDLGKSELETAKAASPSPIAPSVPATQPANVFVVRNVEMNQVAQLRDVLDQQRSGRQHAELVLPNETENSFVVDQVNRPQQRQATEAYPAQDAAAVARQVRAASTQPAQVNNEAAYQNAPATQSAMLPENMASNIASVRGDVLVVVVANAEAPTTAPATAPASLPSPTSAPAILPTTLPTTRS